MYFKTAWYKEIPTDQGITFIKYKTLNVIFLKSTSRGEAGGDGNKSMDSKDVDDRDGEQKAPDHCGEKACVRRSHEEIIHAGHLGEESWKKNPLINSKS